MIKEGGHKVEASCYCIHAPVQNVECIAHHLVRLENPLIIITFNSPEGSSKDLSVGTLRQRIDESGLYLAEYFVGCLLYTSPSPRDATLSRMPSSA